MRNKIMALFATLALALVPASLAGITPAHASKPSPGLSTGSNPTVSRPPSLAGVKAAPARKGGVKQVPQKPGGFSTLALASGYHYAGASETPATAQGYFHSNMFISQPTCTASAGNHSLAELTMQAGSVSGAYRDNILEFGWACEPGAFGDAKVHLFASCWRNNVWAGSYVGGCGFRDLASNPINLGADLTATGLNLLGTTKKFAVQYNVTPCGTAAAGMWIWFDTAWLGCFPTDGVGGDFPSTFTGGGFFQAFDEAYKATSPGICLGMGNDLFPTTTTTPTAYFNTLSHVTTGAANGQFNTAIMTDPTVYGALKLTPAVWRTGGLEPAPC